MANCSNCSKFSNIWCICRLPWEDKAGTSLHDGKSREGNSIDHTETYIDVITG